MITASVGIGTDLDAYKAGTEACLQALQGLALNQAHILFVFGSTSFDQEKLMKGISEISGECLVIGCSTSGEISSEGYSAEKSVVVMAISSDQMKFWGGVGQHVPRNSKQAGEECANALEYASHGYVTSALFFLDILSGNGDLMLEGAFGLLGKNFPLFGCAASDNLLFYETYQYLGNKIYSGAIVGVGLSGEYKIAGVVKHGFLPVGLARKVTKSEGTTLFELDGKPAVSIYEDYFGEEHLQELREGLLPMHTVGYPLGIFLPESNNVMLRNPVFVDQHGAMTFTAAIPEGAEIRLMISDLERGLETAELAAKEVLLKLEGRKPKAVIIMSSVARKIMLGVHADEEIQIIQNIIGRDVPIVGLYSYAQVGGQQGDEIPFQNGSLLIWALGE
jgi:hypothetical protein